MIEGQLSELSESEGQKLFFLILAHMLSCWVPSTELLGTHLCTLSFLEASSCSQSAIKHLNMLQIWWEGALNFHLGSLIIKQDPVFSLCLLPDFSEGTRGGDHGSQEEPALWCPQLTTHPLQRWGKEMGGLNLSSCLEWEVVSPCSAR